MWRGVPLAGFLSQSLIRCGRSAVPVSFAPLYHLFVFGIMLLSQLQVSATATSSTDDLSRRISATATNGTSSTYAYEDTGALDALSHTLGGGGSVAYGYDYNRALQIVSRTTDNDLYAWTNHYNVTRAYAVNGLDQYTRVGPWGYVWDARGNLLSNGGRRLGYDGENRLSAIVDRSATTLLAYDPAGRPSLKL